jgi:hypothetical protein
MCHVRFELHGWYKRNVRFFRYRKLSTGITWFTPGLGAWDFRRKLKQKCNWNIRKYVRSHSKIFSSQHKILEQWFILWNLPVENCILFIIFHWKLLTTTLMSPTCISSSLISFAIPETVSVIDTSVVTCSCAYRMQSGQNLRQTPFILTLHSMLLKCWRFPSWCHMASSSPWTWHYWTFKQRQQFPSVLSVSSKPWRWILLLDP